MIQLTSLTPPSLSLDGWLGLSNRGRGSQSGDGSADEDKESSKVHCGLVGGWVFVVGVDELGVVV